MDTNNLTTLANLWESNFSTNTYLDATRSYLHDEAEKMRLLFEDSNNDMYTSQIFKNLWNKKAIYLGQKEVLNTLDSFLHAHKQRLRQADLFDDKWEDDGIPNIVFSNGAMYCDDSRRWYSKFNIWSGGWKNSQVWNAYNSLSEFVNTMPGILSARLTNGVQVLNVANNNGFRTRLTLTSEPYQSNETSSTDTRYIGEPIIDSGVYVVKINDNARAEIKEIIYDEKKIFCNQWLYVVGYGANLTITRDMYRSEGLLDNLKIIQYPNSTVRIDTHDRGDQWRNIDVIAYQDTTTILNGSTLLKNNSSANIVDVKHKGNNGNSKIKYNSAIYDTNVGNFIGTVNVDKRSVGTKSVMENKNLLVDAKAKAVAKPILHINTKEIECSHGCTTSKIPDDLIYYLETLGLNRSTAKSIIANGHIQI